MPELERLRWGDVEGVRVGRFRGRPYTTCIVWRCGGALIDSGPPNQWRQVRAFARERPVELVVATHHHEDHAGNLAPLQALGLRVVAPRQSLELLARGFPLQLYRRLVWGRPGRVEAEDLPPRLELPDGRLLEAVFAPGHSPDMTCLLDRERRLLFAADLYLGRRLRYLRADEDLDGILASLRRCLDADFDTLLCSHRGIVPDAKAALAEKLENLLALRAEVHRHAASGEPVRRVTRRLLGPEDALSWLSALHFSKRNLVRACLTPSPTTSPGPRP